MAHNTGTSIASQPGVSQELVRTQLERILGNEIFSRSERLSRFLRYVVEQTLAGRGDGLKEQVLGLELYGKSLEAEDDSTVRVDARRLRDKLREYYAEWPKDPVIITLPKGSYVPAFQLNGPVPLPKPSPMAPEPAQAARRFFSARGILAAVAGMLGIGATLAWYPWSPRHLPEQRIIAATSYPGGENQPSLSPDGNLVAFMWSGSEAQEPQRIWIKAVDGDALRPLTSGPFPEVSPAWSPDGREIAFIRPGRGIYIVSQLGGPERQISQTGSLVKWAPDGHSVLIRNNEPGKPPGIVEIDLASGRRHTLIQPESGGGIFSFAVSPDGATVAISLDERPGIGDIYLIPRAGGPPQRLTYGYSTVWSLTWMPDGREIIYAADHTLRRVAVRNGKASALFIPIRKGLDSPTLSSAPGRPIRLAFVTAQVEFALRLIDLKAPQSNGTFEAVTPLADSDSREWPGIWSRDGSRLAFISERGGWRPELWVVNRDNSGVRQLTRFDAAEVDGGSWSPDGRQLALDASVDGNSDIYVIPADGGPSLRLTTDPAVDRRPAWSRDGKSIYFSSNRSGRVEIWRLPVEGGPAVQLTHTGGYEAIPDLEGKALYFLRGGGPDDGFAFPQQLQPGRLIRIPISGGSEEAIADGIRFGKWSVTADGIAYLTAESGFEAIDLYEFATGRIRRLGRLPFRVVPWPDISHLTVSEDGRFAVTTTIERADSNISLVEDFR